MRGRHFNLSCYFLAQSYTKICKNTAIRENFNFFILFKQDMVNLRQIHTEHISDSSFKQFKQLCNKCWSNEPHGFLTIDLENDESPTCRYKFKLERKWIV